MTNDHDDKSISYSTSSDLITTRERLTRWVRSIQRTINFLKSCAEMLTLGKVVEDTRMTSRKEILIRNGRDIPSTDSDPICITSLLSEIWYGTTHDNLKICFREVTCRRNRKLISSQFVTRWSDAEDLYDEIPKTIWSSYVQIHLWSINFCILNMTYLSASSK